LFEARNGDDFWAWNLEKSGIYTVKTAYGALVMRNEHLAPAEGTATGSSFSEKQMWEQLWKLKVVPKVRVFWWRVLRGILPVEQTLQYRHIATLARCKICLSADEDMRHALLLCTHAMRFWAEARVALDVKVPNLHPSTWARDVLCDPIIPTCDRGKIITVMWAIWTSRNNITHDREGWDPIQSMVRMKNDLALLDIPRQQALMLPGFGWRPPDERCIKINTDAGLAFEERKGGAGGVVRDLTGFIAAWSKPLPGITDPMIVEAMALREGVIFAKLRGYSRVVVEVDCLEIVNLWDSRAVSRAVIAPILQDIAGLSSSFSSFVVQHVIRSSNTVAHICAKYACTLELTSVWMEHPPSFLVASLQADSGGAAASV
jgi:hypothetical protein